jgi:uncharacterized membrane protein
MPTDRDPPRARLAGDKGRMEAISDGVFGVAMTLLVVDIAVHPPGSPLHQLLAAWPSYLAYVISFLTVGAAWLGHSALTAQLDRTDAIFLRLNLFLLMVVAFLPFPTRLIADALQNADRERVAVTLYGPTLLCIRLLGFALVAYAQREQLFKASGEGEELSRDRRHLVPVVIVYLTAILIGLAAPKVAVALYLALAIYLLVPIRELRRVFSRRH